MKRILLVGSRSLPNDESRKQKRISRAGLNRWPSSSFTPPKVAAVVRPAEAWLSRLKTIPACGKPSSRSRITSITGTVSAGTIVIPLRNGPSARVATPPSGQANPSILRPSSSTAKSGETGQARRLRLTTNRSGQLEASTDDGKRWSIEFRPRRARRETGKHILHSLV